MARHNPFRKMSKARPLFSNRRFSKPPPSRTFYALSLYTKDVAPDARLEASTAAHQARALRDHPAWETVKFLRVPRSRLPAARAFWLVGFISTARGVW